MPFIKLDIKSLPLSIRKYLDGLKYSIDNIGKSNFYRYLDEFYLNFDFVKKVY